MGFLIGFALGAAASYFRNEIVDLATLIWSKVRG